eukprot:scaffold2830_cov131-Cylindrotheca_fusiformis.AAC.25
MGHENNLQFRENSGPAMNTDGCKENGMHQFRDKYQEPLYSCQVDVSLREYKPKCFGHEVP